jgi:hypothetical protein
MGEKGRAGERGKCLPRVNKWYEVYEYTLTSTN